MTFTYQPKSVCSTRIDLDIDEEGILRACSFDSGCQGNLSGISRLVIDRPAREVAAQLKGVTCRNGTSCPDQLAKAIDAFFHQKG